MWPREWKDRDDVEWAFSVTHMEHEKGVSWESPFACSVHSASSVLEISVNYVAGTLEWLPNQLDLSEVSEIWTNTEFWERQFQVYNSSK